MPAPLATADAVAVARLRQAGAVILGALQTYEFATVGPDEGLDQPPACNPWHVDHITGGSSSGSAAAVDGTNYETADNANAFRGVFVPTGTALAAQRLVIGPVPLPPTLVQPSLINKTGQALASANNTLKILPVRAQYT